MWTLFELQHQYRDQVGLLVQSNASRRRKVMDEVGDVQDLRASVEGLPKVAMRRLKIEAQGTRGQGFDPHCLGADQGALRDLLTVFR